MWRGPSSSGIAPGGSPPIHFGPDEGVRWKTPVPGRGNSSPCVWDDVVLLTTEFEDADPPRFAVIGIDFSSGRILWQTDVPGSEAVTHPKNGRASATVVTDGRRLFASFGRAGLFAFDMRGKQLWRADLGPVEHIWGSASSPVLFEDSVVQQCDYNGSSYIAAFDQATGNELWRTARPSTASWSTPVVVDVGAGEAARKELVVNGTANESGEGLVMAYDPHDGRELWRVSGTTQLVTPTPIVCGDLVYSLSGRNGAIIAIRPGGAGDVTETHVTWKLSSGGPYIPTGIAYRNRLYVLGDAGNLVCYNPGNGASLWSARQRGTFSASLVAADGRLYSCSEQGDVFIFKAADEYRELARNRFGERILATPAIVDGDLLLRTESTLYCFAGDARSGTMAGMESPRLKTAFPTTIAALSSTTSPGEATAAPSHTPAGAAAVQADTAVAQPGTTAWPLFRGDPQSTGVSHGELPDKLEVLWRFTVAKGGFEATAVIADDRVYVGSTDNNFYALRLSDGKKLWEFPTELGFTAPAAFRDGRVFVGDSDGIFYCLDAATGKKLWSFTTDAEINSAPNFHRDRVIFGSQDGLLYCLTCDTGALVWKYESPDQIRSMPTRVGDRALVAGCDGMLHMIDLERGEQVAEVDLGGPTGCTAAASGDRVFVGIEGDLFHAVDWRAALVLWTFTSPERGATFRSSAAIAGDAVVVGSRDRHVHSLNAASGEPIWSFRAKAAIDSSPLIVGSRVYVGSSDGRLYTLDLATGKELAQFEAGGDILAAPVMAQGRLVIGTDQRDLYCLGAKR